MLSIEPLLREILDDEEFIMEIMHNADKLNTFRRALNTKSYDKNFNYETYEFFGDGLWNSLLCIYILTYYKYYSIDFLSFYSSIIDRHKGKFILYSIGKKLKLETYIKSDACTEITGDDIADCIESLCYAIYIVYTDKKYAMYQIYLFIDKFIKPYLDELDIENIADYGNVITGISGLNISDQYIKYKDEVIITRKKILDPVLSAEKRREELRDTVFMLSSRNIDDLVPLTLVKPVYTEIIDYTLQSRNKCLNWIKEYYDIYIDSDMFSIIKDDIYSKDSLVMSSITRAGNDLDPGLSPFINYKFYNGTIVPSILTVSIQKYITKKYPYILKSNSTKLPDVLTNIVNHIRNDIIDKLALTSNIDGIIISNYEIATNPAIISSYTSILGGMALAIEKIVPYGIWYVSELLSNILEYKSDIFLTIDKVINYDLYLSNINNIRYKHIPSLNKDEPFISYAYYENNLVATGKYTNKNGAKKIVKEKLIHYLSENMIKLNDINTTDYNFLIQ